MNALSRQREQRASARRISRWWKKTSNRRHLTRRGSSFGQAVNRFFHTDSSGSVLSEMSNDMSPRAMYLGKESFQAMNKASAAGDVLIVEKCYVMIGGTQSEQLLHLRLLEHMIQEEGDVSPTEITLFLLQMSIFSNYHTHIREFDDMNMRRILLQAFL